MAIIGQIYKITNIKNGKIYIGLTYKKKHKENAFNIRFNEHMSGKGSSLIYRDISNGYYSSVDFKIELLENNIDNVEKLRELEIEYIKSYNSLCPNGYNGNRGNFIIQTEDVIAKSSKTRKEKRHTYKKPKHDGLAVYVSKLTNKAVRINKNDKRVINGELVHINYKGPNSKEFINKIKIKEERAIFNGKTKAEYELSLKLTGNTTITKHPNWISGRKAYKDRMNKKKFTENELKSYKTRSSTVQNDWNKRDSEYRKTKTKNGQICMNKIIHTCPHCNKITNIGNFNRWHGEKCREKKYDIE